MKSKKKVVIGTSLAAILALIIVSVVVFSLPASAAEYMKNTAVQRKELAEARYDELISNPQKESEVLISLKNVNLNQLNDLISDDYEIISVYHYYTDGKKVVTGAYTACSGKKISEIQSAYLSEISGMLESNIQGLTSDIDNYYYQYMLDYSIDVDDFDPLTIDPDWAQEESLAELNERLLFNTIHLEKVKGGEIILRGVRVKGLNSDIVKLLDSDNISMIEILDFDNNNLIAPVISD